MAILRVHLKQNWFGYSDLALEVSLYETTIYTGVEKRSEHQDRKMIGSIAASPSLYKSTPISV